MYYNYINICEIFDILLTITKNMCCYFKMHLIIYARKKPSLVNKDLAFEYKRQKKRTRQLAIFAGASPTIVAVKVLNF